MKIKRILIYRTALPYVDGEYGWGAGNAITTAHTTVVLVDTDGGVSGCGEFCPCGDNYMEAHSEGTEATARLLTPALLGKDPRHPRSRLLSRTALSHLRGVPASAPAHRSTHEARRMHHRHAHGPSSGRGQG